MLLHPNIFNSNALEASEVLGIPRTTLLGWVSTNPKRNFVPKWFDLVSRLCWGEVKKSYSPEIVELFSHVEDDRKLKLTKFRELKGDCVVLTKYCDVPPAKRAKLARLTRCAKARGEMAAVGNFTIINM